MRNNTQRIYERLIRGEFLSVDSSDNSIRHLYDDLEENFEDYTDYFKEVGLQLEQGNGYFYFSRIGEGKQAIEQRASLSGLIILTSLNAITKHSLQAINFVKGI